MEQKWDSEIFSPILEALAIGLEVVSGDCVWKSQIFKPGSRHLAKSRIYHAIPL